MGDSEATDDEIPKSSTPIEPIAPASQPFEALNTAPPSQGIPAVRRSSIRPAPMDFKPTRRESAKLPPPMVIHSGDAEDGAPAWGDPELVSYPSQVKVDRLEHREPFAFAEDLHLATLPLELPKAPGVPNEAKGFADQEALEPVPDSSNAVTQTRLEPPTAEATRVKDAGRPTLATLPPSGAPVRANVTASPAPLTRGGLASPSKRRTLFSGAAAFVLLGLVVAVFAGGRSKEVSIVSAEGTPSALVAAVAPSPVITVSPPVVATAPAATAQTAIPSASAAQVTVKLNPPDSKLTYRGVAVSGPPYVVEVPKGKKVSLEASRKGFVTRKVTVDSTKSVVAVGLVADKKLK